MPPQCRWGGYFFLIILCIITVIIITAIIVQNKSGLAISNTSFSVGVGAAATALFTRALFAVFIISYFILFCQYIHFPKFYFQNRLTYCLCFDIIQVKMWAALTAPHICCFIGFSPNAASYNGWGGYFFLIILCITTVIMITAIIVQNKSELAISNTSFSVGVGAAATALFTRTLFAGIHYIIFSFILSICSFHKSRATAFTFLLGTKYS